MITNIKADTGTTGASTPLKILGSVLCALKNRKVSEAVDSFDDHFTFDDHALGLRFTDKRRLNDFLQKSRELFPDAVLEVTSAFESGDHVTAEWTLSATEIAPFGSLQLRVPISLHGASVVSIENGKVTRWSDYYDQATSHRAGLAALFIEWKDY